MKNRNLICRLVFFAVMLVLVFSVAVCAAAETTDPCPEGAQHKGPFSYRNRINATCTEQGQQDKYCDACGRFVGTEPIGAIGHLFEKSPKVIKAPDCYNDGLEQQTEICKVCGYNKGSVDVVLPKLGHDWGPWRVTTAPTCTTAGVETRICKRDSSHVETNPLAALGHNWGPWQVTKQPACEVPGENTRTCKNDPAHQEHEPIAPIGHKWDSGKVTREPDCTNPGIRTYTCQNDPTHTRIEKLGVLSMNNNTVCAFGPRLRADAKKIALPYYSTQWYMYTPFDASVEGKQTFDLVASNMYIVGTVTLTIRDGNLLIDYKLSDPNKFTITLEFFTVLNRINDLTDYEPENLMHLAMNKGQFINLQEKFGDDTNLVLYFCSRCDYSWSNRYTSLNYNSTAHQRLLNQMISLMD